MPPSVHPLFEAGAPTAAGEESFEELLTARAPAGFRLERIVSRGAASPPDFWYDQAEAEWVALLQGEAQLEFEDGVVALKAGDALMIPTHQRHRVAATSLDAVWLALHFAKE